MKPNLIRHLKAIKEIEPLPSIRITENRSIGDDQPCFIIAEVGQNHNGEMEMARDLIDNIAFYGADAAKFCKRDIHSELTREAYDQPYVSPHSFGETYGKHREYLELTLEQHQELAAYAAKAGVIFFATACDMKSVDDLDEVGVSLYKVASRDLTNLPLLDYMARTMKPVILSSGMDSMEEIKEAIDTVRRHHNNIVLMHCISSYPTNAEDVNLFAMHRLRTEFGVLVGMSDHTIGVMVPVVAAALGAVAVEKHVTMGRHLKGTDHACSLEPNGLRMTVRDIRNLELALGDGRKTIPANVGQARAKLCRSLVSRHPIPRGTAVTEDMLCLKSPGTGLKWRDRGRVVGLRARHDVPADVVLDPDTFE